MLLDKTTGAAGKLALVFGLALTVAPACAGKSVSHRGDGDDDDGSGGTSGRGGTSGAGGDGGTSGAGGDGGTSGAGGDGGTSGVTGRGGTSTGGTTSNAVVQRITQSSVDKVDLLFVVDNSISMAHKQRLLAESVPLLVQRFVDPICIDANGQPAGGTASAGCGSNRPEFPPIQDIHIGVITSSLGNHGGDVCVSDPTETPPRFLNDAAQLLPSVREALYSYQNQSFLVWDPRSERPNPEPHPGLTEREQVAEELATDVAEQIEAATERGCGYEAPLEAWYRFLVDPEPVNSVTVDPSGQFSVRGPVNPVVLQQRAAFLRPDSLLGIVMLTDENDCSILDENASQGWLVGRRAPMPRGSDACSRPDDPEIYRCCVPCVFLDVPDALPQGCSYANDVSCGAGHSLDAVEDSTNLRCFDQRRRFGLDWLYRWQRYVEALTSRFIVAHDGGDALNPIFTPGADGTPARDPSLVFLAGIVGVPWQDLADEASLTGRGLTYLTSQELTARGRWDVVLGDPDLGVLPEDPFMVESVDPRSGSNPITGDTLAPPPSGGVNAINGHEQYVMYRDDLQYACIFQLPEPVPCTMSNQDGCDCNASEEDYARPTCDYARANADGAQIAAKAYPSLRQLQVLKGLGDNAIVTSICAKNVEALGDDPTTDPDYGYNPAVGAMVGRFSEALGARCLPRPLEVDSDGRVPCAVVETRLPSSVGCSCASPGRLDLPARGTTREAVESELALSGYCDGSTSIACSDYCSCEIEEFSSNDLVVCRDQAVDPGVLHGFCYVDPDNGYGNPDLVSGCAPTQRRLLRFMGDALPAPDAQAFIVCTDE